MKFHQHQTLVNMMATLLSFCVVFFVNFYTAPFIVKSLGAAAYGFIGLTTTIVNYSQLITVAINSMAGRYISIAYLSNDIKLANKYFSSVFFSNIVISSIVLLLMLIIGLSLENIFEIPQTLVRDVQILFLIVVFNTIFSLLTNVFSVSTFIANRLDLASIRQIFSKILYALALLILFNIFTPKLWIVGFGNSLMFCYIGITNFCLARKLTPQLKISGDNFSLIHVKEIFLSGIWNIITKLSEILGTGFDLILANLFIGATEMGLFSITKQVPILILSLFQMLAGVFAPILTKLYAEHNKDRLTIELLKSIRILGFVTAIPLTALFIFGESFYHLWIPSENTRLLYLLTIISSAGMFFSMPLEALWNIFTITNKVKIPSIVMLINNILVFLTIIILIYMVPSDTAKLFILAGSRAGWGTIRSLLFLPMFGAHCLSLKKYLFYKPLFRSFFCTIICMGICYCIKINMEITSWKSFVFAILMSSTVCIIIGYVGILTKNEKKIVHKLWKNK